MNRHNWMDRNKSLVRTALGLILLMSIALITGAAQVEPPIQNTTFLYERVRVLDPGRVWTDRTGIHIRSRVDLGVLSGDIRGEAVVVYNADLPIESKLEKLSPPEPAFGQAYGTIRIYALNDRPADSVWEGTWQYEIQSGEVVSGNLTATNFDHTRVLVIDSVQQLYKEVLELNGYFDYLFCLEASCEPIPSEN